MIIKELQLLTEALWESVKTDLEFFAPIKVFVKRLSEVDFSDSKSLPDITLYANKIEEFFGRYRPEPDGGLYFPPNQTYINDTTVKSINRLVKQLNALPQENIDHEFDTIKFKSALKSKGTGKIFIGHGRSRIWARLQIFLKDDLNLSTLTFEDESRTSENILNILQEFLDNSSLAILVMTAEDDMSDGNSRARQNVIHEAGLFQGRLGFDRVIILKQEGIEEFSNIAGMQYIPFTGDNIEQCFYELQRKLKKSGMIS